MKYYFAIFSAFVFLSLGAANPKNCITVCFNEQEFLFCEDEKENATQSGVLQYHTGQLYLKLKYAKPDVKINEQNAKSKYISPFEVLAQTYGIKSIEPAFKRLPQMRLYYKVKFEKTELTDALIRELNGFDFVEFVEKVPYHRTFYTPNDINTANIYNLTITQAELAWDITTGSNQIVIGMVDDAVRIDHEDLAPNIWTNPGEIAGNGVDDDGNGYVDDVNGWDAGDNDNDPNPPAGAGNFNFSHGTHCAGIAAAATDNGIGMASVSFNVQLMAIKGADDATESLVGVMAGVEYAIASGADVISMSWGGGAPSATEQAVFDVAHDAGIVLVAAAGNDNVADLMYPASYEHVISVAATDNGDLKADFSNFGDSIDVAAPGVQIWSTVATTTSSYEFYDGTSMACPYVSGLAALMLSFDPSATPERIEECLETTADDIYPLNPGFVGQLGAGRVNAQQAVMCTPSVPYAAFEPSTEFPCAGETFTFNDFSAGTDLTDWQWSFPGGTPSSSTDQNPSVTYPNNGTYDVTLTVINALGTDMLTKSITVGPPTATLSGDNVILQGYIVPLQVDFTGTPPFGITYTDGVAPITINGIMDNPYEIDVSPEFTTSYELTAIGNDFCTGTFSGNPTIVVIVPDEPNDQCDFALPFPTLTTGNESCINGSNGGANGELPYINQATCNGETMPVPAADVWYTFYRRKQHIGR